MKNKLLFIIVFFLNNAYAEDYKCNQELTITKFNTKQLTYNRTVTGDHKVLDSYSYFVFDNNDMLVVHQHSCLMTDYYISYYYNDIIDFNIMYKNYLSVLDKINYHEGISVSSELKSKLGDALSEEEIKDTKYFNGYYSSYPLKLKRNDMAFQYSFELSTDNYSSPYKNVLSTYIAIGGMP